MRQVDIVRMSVSRLKITHIDDLRPPFHRVMRGNCATQRDICQASKYIGNSLGKAVCSGSHIVYQRVKIGL